MATRIPSLIGERGESSSNVIGNGLVGLSETGPRLRSPRNIKTEMLLGTISMQVASDSIRVARLSEYV